jgi:DNA (cytosine-5)-methyltransferase 1
MTHGSLFSGIGGFDLAASWMQWENIFHCELSDFGRKVLNHYWPHAVSYEDIKKTDFTKHRGFIHVLSGGFPCQPFSLAGHREGTDDDRNLWPEMFRAIREISPRWVVGENVRGLTNWDAGVVFDNIQADMESEGYQVTPFLLPASAVNAPHERFRIWFVAHATGFRVERDRAARFKVSQVPFGADVLGRNPSGNVWENGPTEPPFCGVDDGIPRDMDGITFSKWWKETVKAYGNAIVPQVAFRIFQAIADYEKQSA